MSNYSPPAVEVPVFHRPLPIASQEDARWKVCIRYRTSTGLNNEFKAYVEDIADVHEIVERGPHFDCVEGIDIIRVNHSESATLTVEEAREL